MIANLRHCEADVHIKEQEDPMTAMYLTAAVIEHDTDGSTGINQDTVCAPMIYL